jgi:23S rRNA (uracil1939-C5)-methyltransferase
MEIGKEYEVDVIDMSPNGEGIGKIKTFPVFIKGAKLNEHVKVRITALGCGAADAEVVP